MRNILGDKVQNATVFQSNAITEARYEMSSLQKNIFYLLLAQLKDKSSIDEPIIKYKLSIRNINASRNIRVNKSELRQAAIGLVSSGLTLYDETQKGFITIGILASADYGEGPDKENLIIEFDLKLYPFLYSIKSKFTAFSLQNALNLKSKYSKRIYEMLSMFKGTGLFRVSVQELKERFELIDSKTGREVYPEFGNFANKVLEVAKKEINESTEISFDYTTKKTGRKITALEFKITTKEAVKELTESTPVDPQVAELKERLVKKFQISKTLAKRVLEHIPIQEIRKILHGIQFDVGDGKIKKIGAYSTTLFQNRLDGAAPITRHSNIPKYLPPKSLHQIPIERSVSSEQKLKTARSGPAISIGEQLAQAMASSRPIQIQNNSLSEEELRRYEEEKKEKEELKKQKEENYRVWRKLYNDFRIDYLEVNLLMKRHSLENLKAAISKVSQEIRDQETPLESSQIIQLLKKHLNLD